MFRYYSTEHRPTVAEFKRELERDIARSDALKELFQTVADCETDYEGPDAFMALKCDQWAGRV